MSLIAVTTQIIAGAQYLIAESVLDLDKWFGGKNKTPFGEIEAPGKCASGIDALVIYAGGIINLLMVILVVVAIILMITAGLRYVNSGGDQNAVQEASQFARDIILGLAFTFLFLIGLSLLFSAFGPDQSGLLIC
jgi:hypothetical protein